MYNPTLCEVQSKHSRVAQAENLILQMPINHDGRNTWLMNFCVGEAAKRFRADRGLHWVRETEACETTGEVEDAEDDIYHNFADSECEGCGGGEKVPAGEYFRCPVCDSEWPEVDE